jgi:lipopolysaccharide transport system ATP-binding protein
MKPAIRVENLSKQYRIGTRSRRANRNLTESIVEGASAFWRGLTQRAGGDDGADHFWALKDVSFEVQPGEVVGIIGRNGAGKSTLLKILSRITEPTSGRAVVRGRMGSLLEVGTGFHPELTGLENIYLNGSVLGMSRREIDRKFDEIVAFAGVEGFLNTPVKRYSSGMYVRLAFAVAAHLEPGILIVDEVLAVGDVDFQRRCFEKMDELRRSGRTVLLVSHNLGSVVSLAGRVITLDQGVLVSEGRPDREVSQYLLGLTKPGRCPLGERNDREGDGRARIVAMSFRNGRGELVEQAICGESLNITLGIHAIDADEVIDIIALSCWTIEGTKVFHVDNHLRAASLVRYGRDREYICEFPRLPLPPGLYQWNALLKGDGHIRDHVRAGAVLEVLPGDFFRVGRTTPIDGGGIVFLDHLWK